MWKLKEAILVGCTCISLSLARTVNTEPSMFLFSDSMVKYGSPWNSGRALFLLTLMRIGALASRSGCRLSLTLTRNWKYSQPQNDCRYIGKRYFSVIVSYSEQIHLWETKRFCGDGNHTDRVQFRNHSYVPHFSKDVTWYWVSLSSSFCRFCFRWSTPVSGVMKK